jgi:glycosyltransferase involved in cell wall biosynthesis
MKISYAITVCNELEEVSRLLNFLHQYKRPEDEICVLLDKPKASNQLIDELYYWASKDIITLKESTFQGHFADWKNELTSICSGDYIFQIDADELPNEELLQSLPNILTNSKADVILTPRINIVEDITPQHLQMWDWKQNDKGWIQFPDYQWRIFRNAPDIVWKNKVHEVLDGYKTYAYLPEFEEYSLYHYKHISRQESQNNFYRKL